MKVAYVTPYDSGDVHAWSGLGYWIGRAVREAGLEVTPYGGLHQEQVWMSYAKRLFYPNVMGKRFLRDREPRIIRGYGRQISSALAGMECDVVMGPGTAPFTWVETDRPLVFWTDSVFADMLDFYPDFSNLCAETIRWGHFYEQTVLDRCTLAIYSSRWAADGAIRHYGADPAKVKVVPFGANIDTVRTEAEIRQILEEKPREQCRLLFAGVDWKRKGGDFLLEVAAELHRRGVPVAVDIVGATPEVPMLPEYVTVHGFISKKTPEGRARFDELMRKAHFLVLPTLADCAPVVLAEAGSFGLPSLTTAVGGIGSQIVNGQNGWIYPLEAPASVWAERVEAVFADWTGYAELALSTFGYYSENLNWSSAGRRVRELLEGIRPDNQRPVSSVER